MADHIHDLALILEDLEAQGRLARVKSEVSLTHELAGVAATLEGKPRAVLFEKVAGHPWPVVTGLYWSRELLGALMRQPVDTLPQYVSGRIAEWQKDPVDPVVRDDGPVLEVTENDVDLSKMPIPVHAERDGGAYFDAGVVIAKDPETGIRNASIQRFQVVAKDRLHVNIDAGRHLEAYLEKAKKLGRTLTFTLNCGVGPGLHFAGSTPAEAAPIDTDELGIASAFDGRPVELVRASNGHDEMAARAMWALECEIIPGEVANEGPFAEVTNYYATVAPRPVVHVRKIHRRREPVFQTILSGMEVWNSVGLLGEANVLALLQKQVPGVHDVYFSHGGCGFYHCVVQMTQARAGWAKQAILAAFAAFPPLKMVTVVDEDVDLTNPQDVEWAMATRLDPTHGIVTIDKAFGHGLNPSFPDYLGPKVGFDCTKPYPPRYEYERATYRKVDAAAFDIAEPEILVPALVAAATVAQPVAETAGWHAPAARAERLEARLKRHHAALAAAATAAPALADIAALRAGEIGRTAPPAAPAPEKAPATVDQNISQVAPDAVTGKAPADAAPAPRAWREPAERMRRAIGRLSREHARERLHALSAPALADVAALGRPGLSRQEPAVATPAMRRPERDAPVADAATGSAAETSGDDAAPAGRNGSGSASVAEDGRARPAHLSTKAAARARLMR